MIIRTFDKRKPVLLFLHGGPGIPELFFMKDEVLELEKHFVMVYWEQRGAGKSYCKNECELSLKILIEDTKELAQILCNQFSKDKIYIMGHSWGSLLGLMTVKTYPQFFYSYFGIGQVTNQYEAEKSSLQWVTEQAKNNNNFSVVKKLSNLTLPSKNADTTIWDKYLRIHRKYLLKYGGTFHQKPNFWKILKNFLFASEYTIKDKIKFIPSALYSLKKLWFDVINTNLFFEIKKVDVPVYIFQGKYDYQVSTELAKKFIEQLEAPKKEIFIFDNSAHSPNTEEYKKFNKRVKQLVDKQEPNNYEERNKLP